MLTQLHRQLDSVDRRKTRLKLWHRLFRCWIAAALIGLFLWFVQWSSARPYPWLFQSWIAATLMAGLIILATNRRKRSNPRDLVKSIERLYPELNDLLLTASAQQPSLETGRLNFLQRRVVGDALSHSYRRDWQRTVPTSRLFRAFCLQALALTGLVVLAANLWRFEPSGPFAELRASLPDREAPGDYGISVDPGHAEIERGTTLFVSARFAGRLPAETTLVARRPSVDESATKQSPSDESRITLHKSLDDPLFSGSIGIVEADCTYLVEYDGNVTEEFKITVFEYPQLLRADAIIRSPEYTGQPPQTIEDTRQVSVVEGSTVTLECSVNKPLTAAFLYNDDGERVELKSSSENPTRYMVELQPEERQWWKLRLIDDSNRENRHPPEFLVDVFQNRPPDLKLAFPARDLQVSPLEELTLEAQAWDDYGLKQQGFIYSIGEAEPQTIVLNESAPARHEAQLKKLLSLEELNATPDQLVSYYFFADDVGPGGETRRTRSDMFFAEVRHFEEIFREGQAPPGGAGMQQAGSQNAQQAEELANLQKEIINATWKIIRREAGGPASDPFVEDTRVILQAQQEIHTKMEEFREQLTDAQSLSHLTAVTEHMTRAAQLLEQAAQEKDVPLLDTALAAEQSAYQAMLKLRAREHQVVQSQSGGGGGGGGGGRSQQQLNQLELDNKQNRYETERSASTPQEQQQRENLQVLSRLKELARRQSDLNQKMRELDAALRTAESEQERKKLERQLKRLRDEMQNLLRDTDELRNRMDQPQNQREMAESQRQLDEARNQVRQSSEKLEQGMLSQALNAGARAEQKLDELQEEFRQKAAGQFTEEMRDMRQQARDLAEREAQIGDQLQEARAPEPDNSRPTLRKQQDRPDLAQELQQQRQSLDQLYDRMKQVVREAEDAEPLLAKRLYETIRDSRRQPPEEALDAATRSVKRGDYNTAAGQETVARQGIDSLKEGIEDAAEGVLGNELESLKRARDELRDLADAVDRELDQPGRNQTGNRSVAQADPRSPAGQSPSDQSPSGEQNQQDQQQSGTPSDQQAQQGGRQQGQPQDRAGQNGGQQSQNGEQRGDNQQPNQQDPNQNDQPQDAQQGQQGQQQNGQQSGNPQPQGQQPGDQQGQKGQQGGQQGQQGGQPQDQQQQGGQQQGQQGGQGGSQGESQQPGGNPNDSPRERPGLRGERQPSPRLGSNEGGRQGGSHAGGPGGPITGEYFQNWSDRMREVEEIIDDPDLRNRAAQVRDRVRNLRIEYKRHSREPNQNLLEDEVIRPLAELQNRLAEEIAKRATPDEIVPLDRDPVPDKYVDYVREYFERLGSGQ